MQWNFDLVFNDHARTMTSMDYFLRCSGTASKSTIRPWAVKMANESDDYTLLLLRELDYIVATQMLGILQSEKGVLYSTWKLSHK